ncbi:UNVERIFIED_CONTAM: hypothetical protein GTU68_019363 [Idotea baltica]|nr:hypothetical protein [Idotea baltica]
MQSGNSETCGTEILLSSPNNGAENNKDSAKAIFSKLSNKFSDIKDAIKNNVTEHAFCAYLQNVNIKELELESNSIILTAPSALVCRYFIENFQDFFLKAFNSNTESKYKIKIEVAKGNKISELNSDGSFINSPLRPKVVLKKVERNKVEKFTGLSNGDLNSNYNFDNFVVGNSNEFTHAASLLVANKPGENYNPLFIYGGVGLGKTHLLHAIGNTALKQNKSVLYMSSETFTNELIHSLKVGKMDVFKNRLRSINVLLIDDIQFIAGKERTQEEFFHTFNTLYNSKNQIVITSDKLPQEISGIEERLRTRFAWGLTTDLQLPDFETRAAIVKKKAEQDNLYVPEDVAKYLANKISTNVRELEGALTRLQAISSLRKKEITLELAESALESITKNKVKVSITDIKGAVSAHFGIRVSEIISKRRTKNLSFPRHIAMYLCRKHTTASYPEIGQNFGGRDHSSVIHAANVVGTKLKTDKEIENIIVEIEQQIFN